MRRTITTAVSIALVVLSAPCEAFAMSLVGNDQGDALALFQVRGHHLRPIEVSGRIGTGVFGPPARLAPPGAAIVDGGSGAVAMGAEGDAVAAWTERARPEDRLLASFRAARGAFEPPVVLSRDVRFYAPRVAVNTRGDAVLAWGPERPKGSDGLMMAFRPAGGDFSQPFSFEPAGEDSLFGGYTVGLADDGTAVVVWRAFDGDRQVVTASTRAPDGTFGPAQILSAPDEGAPPDGLAVNRAGGAIVTWGSRGAIVASERGPGGTFGPAFAVSGPEDQDAAPRGVELNDAGGAVITWQTGARPTQIRAAIRPPGGAFARITIGQVQQTGGSYVHPEGALDSRGNAAFVWRGGNALLGAYRTAEGVLTPPLRLARIGRFEDLSRATGLVMDAAGRATTGWEESGGQRAREMVRSFAAGGAGLPVTLAKRRAWIREGPRSTCFPRHTRTLARSRVARVYKVLRGWDRGYSYGCLYARGAPVLLGSIFDPVFEGPAISLAGPLVGSASRGCEGDRCTTRVDLTDLRDEASARNGGLLAQESPSRGVKVGSLRIRRDGAVGFITCPEDGSFPGDRRPNCIRPGSSNGVWIANAYTHTKKLIARGRGIDPASLRLGRSTLSWLENGTRRIHELGPRNPRPESARQPRREARPTAASGF